MRIRFHFQLISDLKLHFSPLNELVVGRTVNRNYTCSVYLLVWCVHAWIFCAALYCCVDSFYRAKTYSLYLSPAPSRHHMLYRRNKEHSQLSMPCLLCTAYRERENEREKYTRPLNPIILCNYCYYHFGIVCFGTEARFFASHLSFWYVCLYNTTATFMHYSNNRLIFSACFQLIQHKNSHEKPFQSFGVCCYPFWQRFRPSSHMTIHNQYCFVCVCLFIFFFFCFHQLHTYTIHFQSRTIHINIFIQTKNVQQSKIGELRSKAFIWFYFNVHAPSPNI